MKRIGVPDGTFECKVFAIRVEGYDLAQEYDFHALIGQDVSDGLLKMGDQTSQGFIWDFNDEGVVIYNREHGDAQPRYRTVKWGKSIKIKEQNPTGSLVGKITPKGISRIGV